MSFQQYVRFGTVSLDDGLTFLRDCFARRAPRGSLLGQDVKARSLRLRTFAFKGTVCPRCKLAASYFALERPSAAPETQRYHLNLWGVKEDGEHVLFTHDHIIPKARGGADDFENTQTMCGPCNWAKSHSLEEELPEQV